MPLLICLPLSDFTGNSIRKVDASTGAMTIAAGGLGATESGNGTRSPVDVAVVGDSLFILDSTAGFHIRQCIILTQQCTSVAGTGAAGFLVGNGGPAANAAIGGSSPTYPYFGITYGPTKAALYLTDPSSGAVRRFQM